MSAKRFLLTLLAIAALAVCGDENLQTFFKEIGVADCRVAGAPETVGGVAGGVLEVKREFPSGATDPARLSQTFIFKEPVDFEQRIFAVDLKIPAKMQMVRLQFANRGEKTTASFLVAKPKFGTDGFITVAIAGQAGDGVIYEPKLSTGNPPKQIDRLSIHLIGAAPAAGDVLTIELRNPRFLEKLPGPAPAAAKTPDDLPLPADRPFTPRCRIDLSCAAIIAPAAERESALLLQQEFRRNWRLDLPILPPEQAQSAPGSWILLGPAQSNDLLVRLFFSGLLEGPKRGYELRVLPRALDFQRDLFYFGGADPAAVKSGIERFFAKFPQPQPIPFFFEFSPEYAPKETTSEEADRMIEALKAHFRRDDGQLNYFAITSHLLPAGRRYRASGNREDGRALLEMVRLFNDRYLNRDAELQQFMAYDLFRLFDLLEEFELCNQQDWNEMGEVVRRISLSCRNHSAVQVGWKEWQAGRVQYWKNSACFISRSLGTGARYLLARYDYPPARDWRNYADFVFKGVAPHPFSPEDATGYQFMSYEIFMDYALAGGLVNREFFRNEEFLRHVEYIKLQYNHLGWNPGYGDAFALYHVSGVADLEIAAGLLGDREAAYLLAMRHPQQNIPDPRPAPPGSATIGLNLQEVNAFKLGYDFPGHSFKRPLLDKASFRSGWDGDADYLAVTGMNRGFHGHIDGAGIAQYIAGNRLWLFEGDYVERFPIHHNMLAVSRDGLAPLQRQDEPTAPDAAAQITGRTQTPDRRTAALGLLTESLNGTDWQRFIGYDAGAGFWVIDRVKADVEGEFALDLRFRSIGELKADGPAVEIRQKASDNPAIADRFFIVSGDDSSRALAYCFERSHGQKDGNIAGYPYLPGAPDTAIIHRRRLDKLKAGDQTVFVNFCQAVKAGEKPPEVVRLGPGAWRAETSAGPRVALLGSFAAGNVEFTGDVLFASLRGVTGVGVRRLVLEGREIPVAADGTVALSGTVFPFAALPAKGEAISPGTIAGPELPALEIGRVVTFPARITAVAAGRDTIGIGLEDGTFAVVDADGGELWRTRLPAAVSAAAELPGGDGKLRYFVGTGPVPATGDEAKCFLKAFSLDGKELWQKEFGVTYRRNSRITTLNSFRRDAAGAIGLLAGTESWLGYGLDPVDGKELFRSILHHGWTAVRPADLDGEGGDELVAGGPYLYQTIFRADGTTPGRLTRSPGCDAVAVIDADGDKRPEALYGRHDGFVYCMKFESRKFAELWQANAGGPVAALLELPAENQVIAATRAGNLELIDHTGKTLARQYFAAPLTALIRSGDRIFTADSGGGVYEITPKLEPLRKIRLETGGIAVEPPRLLPHRQGVAATAENKLYFLR